MEEMTHHAVSAGTTYLFTAILVVMVLSLAMEEKLHAKKSLIVGSFAVVSLLLASVLGLIGIHQAS